MLIDSQRRKFLKQLGVATAGTLVVPSFLEASTPTLIQNGRRLVVVQLAGGNDGLNTVIPFTNDTLFKARPKIAPAPGNFLKLTDEVALNAAMPGMRDLFESGDVSILNSVGYPNPNRSHFRAMDIWQSGSGSEQYLSTGWLGRYLDNECSDQTQIPALEMGNVLSLALKGTKYKGIPVNNIYQFYQATRSVHEGQIFPKANDATQFLYKTVADTRASAAYLFEKNKLYKTRQEYPQNALGNQLKQIARLIISGVDAPVYYVSLGGFDTHNNQTNRQERLLRMYSDSIKSFADELKAAREWNNTLVLTFSEFGRRVKENASGGTDHGKANNLFLLGGNLKKPGLYNNLPDLENTEEGDIHYEIDFRQVYSTILNKWLSADSRKILNGSFKELGLV